MATVGDEPKTEVAPGVNVIVQTGDSEHASPPARACGTACCSVALFIAAVVFVSFALRATWIYETLEEPWASKVLSDNRFWNPFSWAVPLSCLGALCLVLVAKSCGLWLYERSRAAARHLADNVWDGSATALRSGAALATRGSRRGLRAAGRAARVGAFGLARGVTRPFPLVAEV
jgi:hypothetical protein